MSKINSVPLVSVIIPCYNSQEYIGECIESVLSQDYENIEIIIVDDGSTDSSREVVAKYPVDVFLIQENKGACVARNHGLKLSKGKYIKFLDSDDILESGAIKRQAQISEDLSEDELLYGAFYHYDGVSKKYVKNKLPDGDQTSTLFFKDIYTTTPLHRKTVLEKVEGFDERFSNGQEWNLHIRISDIGVKFIYDHVAVFSYRSHKGKDRVSVIKSVNKNKNQYEIEKTLMTLERMSNKSDLVEKAVAYRYWLIARKYCSDGYFEQAQQTISRYINKEEDYKFYWPKLYRIIYWALGLKTSEVVIKKLRSFFNGVV